MKKMIILVILAAAVVFLSIPVKAASAQDVDENDTSDSELYALFQSIMQKLEQETETEAIEPAAEETPAAAADAEPAAETAESDVNQFTIYENKKLIIESLPDYWFIRPQTNDDDENEDGGDNKDNGFHYGGDVYPVYGESFVPPDVWVVW